MSKKITLAAYLAGVTTLAVSLPAMADAQSKEPVKSSVESRLDSLSKSHDTTVH